MLVGGARSLHGTSGTYMNRVVRGKPNHLLVNLISSKVRCVFSTSKLATKRPQRSVLTDNEANRTKVNIKRTKKKEVKVWFYIALYPVRWTAQSALHFPPLADLFIPTPVSASLGSILAMQQLRNDYSLTFPPLSIARYSFIQLSRLRRREVKENAQTSKR